MHSRVLVVGMLLVSASAVFAQETPSLSAPAASGSPAIAAPNASASPMAAFPTTAEMLENIGKLVKDGHLSIEADLQQGRMPIIPKYTLDVEGDPKTSVAVEAADGKVTHMKFGVENGKLVVRGS